MVNKFKPLSKHVFYKVVVISLLLSLTGCAKLITVDNLENAHESFNERSYDDALVHIRKAEHFNKLNAEIRAELIYIKARSYEALGYERESNALYQHLISEHKTSQYSSLAKIRTK